MKRAFSLGLTAIWSLVLLASSVLAQQPGELDLNDLNQQAANHVRRERYEQALDLYRQIVQHDPFWADIWYNMGEVSRVTDQSNDCVLYFSRYLYLIPDGEDADEVRRSLGACRRDLSDPGTLEVSARPEGSRIAIDGVEIARDHLEPLPLNPGEYHLTIEAIDHEPWAQMVTVTGESAVHLDITLVPMVFYGTLRVLVNVEGAMVTIEDEPVSTTPLTEPIRLQTGRYLVRFSKDGYHDWVRRVEIARDQESLLEVEMREQ